MGDAFCVVGFHGIKTEEVDLGFDCMEGSANQSVEDCRGIQEPREACKLKVPELDVKDSSQCDVPVSSHNVVPMCLQRNCIGLAILQLPKNEPLQSAVRAKLCHEIVVAEMGTTVLKCISKERFLQLAKWIVEIFPQELRETYFIPRSQTQNSGRCINSRGMLYDKYHNVLKFMRKTGLINLKGKKRLNISSDIREVTHTEHSGSIMWLELHSGNFPQDTRVKWLETFSYRLASLRNMAKISGKTKVDRTVIDGYIARYKCLSTARGPELLLLDFESLYGGTYKSLLNNSSETFSRLMKLAGHTDETQLARDPVQCLRLIPGFFNQPIIMHGSKLNRSTWKPNRNESKQGFLIHEQSVAALQKSSANLEKKCHSVHRTLQPFPAVVGPTESDIHQCYVVIGDLLYPMESPLVAVDTCFKMYHALHCQYPIYSSHSWLFLQQAVFGIYSEWDISAHPVGTKVKEFSEIQL